MLTDIRTGRHADFDRVVLDLTGPAPGVNYRLVDELFEDGSGEIAWLTRPVLRRGGYARSLSRRRPAW